MSAAQRRKPRQTRRDPVMEHGRLVARLKRQVAKEERLGGGSRQDKVLATITHLIVLEKRIEDPLAPPYEPTWDDVRSRRALMAPGAGIEVPR